MKRSIAVVLVLTIFFFSRIPDWFRSARAQIASAPARRNSAGAQVECARPRPYSQASPMVTPAAAATPASRPETAEDGVPWGDLTPPPILSSHFTTPRFSTCESTARHGGNDSERVSGSHQIQEQHPRLRRCLAQVPARRIPPQRVGPVNSPRFDSRLDRGAQTLDPQDGVDVNSGGDRRLRLAGVTSDDLDRIEVVRGAGRRTLRIVGDRGVVQL